MKVNTITQFTPTCDAKMQITKQISGAKINFRGGNNSDDSYTNRAAKEIGEKFDLIYEAMYVEPDPFVKMISPTITEMIQGNQQRVDQEIEEMLEHNPEEAINSIVKGFRDALRLGIRIEQYEQAVIEYAKRSPFTQKMVSKVLDEHVKASQEYAALSHEERAALALKGALERIAKLRQ